MKRSALFGLVLMLGGCSMMSPQSTVNPYAGRTVFTCCNIRYEGGEVTDANYAVGTILPAGTAVQVTGLRKNSFTIEGGGTKLSIYQEYGTNEPFEKYMGKVVLAADPKVRLASYSRSAQAAIREGRVERGMTRDQVVMSVGYPATHRTPSLDSPEWTYWYNRWVTYKVQFDASGTVSNIVGRPAPTRDEAVAADPVEAPKKKSAPAKSGKKKK